MKQILQHLLTIGKFKLLKVPKLIKPKWLLGRDVSLNLSLMVLSTAILTLESTAQNLPKVPVSPEAASLMKLVNYPVNLNTGQTDISIPLYNIEAGGLTLPINLSYHSGGFKIHEKATSIGLGWRHSADLQITRSINGLDDFTTGGYIANSKMKVHNGSSTTNYPFYDPSPSAPFTEYEAYRMAFGETDGMPDKFSYKLLNKSGTFYFRKNGAGTSAVIVAVPYDNIKISYANNQFTIVDTDGTTYVYGQQGAVTTTTVASQAVEISNNKITAWKCIRIDNPTKTESINFTYAAKSVVRYVTNVQSVEYYSSESPCGLNSYFMSDQITYLNPSITTYEHLTSLYPFYSLSSPKYIENFADGTSRFHMPYLNSSNQPVDKTFTKMATLPTTEIYGIALSKIDFKGGSAVFTGADQLASIKVQNASLEEIKTFTFFQSYTAPNYLSAAQQNNGPSFLGTRYLDSIQTRNGGVNYGSYKLMYGSKICFGSHLQGSDAWGYYNINTKEMTTAPNYLSIPSQTITQRFYTSITGGCPYVNNVNFTFGNLINLELVEQNVVNAGMLKRIVYPTGGYVDFDFESNMYEQSINTHLDRIGMGGGLRIKSITNFDGTNLKPVSQKYYRYGELENGIGLLLNSPSKEYNLAVKNFNAFSYSQTTAYITGPGSANIGDNFVPVPSNCNNRSCLYVRAKEKKTTYLPASGIDYTFPSGSPIYYTKVTEYNQDFGALSGKKVYTYYKPNDFEAYWLPYQVKVPETNIDFLHTEGLMGAQKSVEDYKYDKGNFFLTHSKAFGYTKRSQTDQIRVAYSYLKTVYEIIGGGFIGSQMDLYNSNISLPSATIEYSPFLYGEYAIQVANLLLTSETEKWYDGSNYNLQTTSYAYSNATYNQPSSITVQSYTGTKVRHLKYAYDFPGNTTYDLMQTKNMVSQLVEEINMRDGVEVARTKTNFASFNTPSFIAASSVQASVAGSALDTVLRYDRYDQFANLLQSTEKRKVIKSYIWGYNYKYLVAEVSGVNYQTATAGINVATLNALTNEAQIKATINSIRTAVPTAMVTTFTIKPLVGISAMYAPNGAAKFHEYDPIGRLNIVKDNDLNIVEKYDYKVTGPMSAYATTPYYVNTPLMSTYNKNCSGLVQVNVIQPGGEFTWSDLQQANSSAKSNLTTNWSTLAGYDDCTASATAEIRLESNVQTSFPYIVPGNVYLDLIKDNSVVVTKQFQVSGYTPIVFNIKPGTYQIAVRFDENYNGSLTRVSLQSSTGGSLNPKVIPGDVIQCVAGGSYSFWLANGN